MPEPPIDHSFEILHETDEFIAVSKSGNCPVHEGGLFKENCLLKLLENKLGYRPYPVYRLDRETSGIVIFAKKAKFVKKLFDSISSKEYLTICKGIIKENLTINAPIGEKKGDYINWKKCVDIKGRNAITIIEPIRSNDGFTLVRVIPKTGRQHQIRVHLSHIGHSIVGDKVYGTSDKLFKEYLEGKKIEGRQLLHLNKIIISGMEIESKIPHDMVHFTDLIRK